MANATPVNSKKPSPAKEATKSDSKSSDSDVDPVVGTDVSAPVPGKTTKLPDGTVRIDH